MTYWEERRKRLDASMAKDEKRLFAKLATYYDREAARLDREIAAYYAKYGEQDVIAYRVLLQNLSDADRQLLLERMDAFAEKYPEYAHLLPVRTSIYKLNRLEGLRQSIAMQQLEMGAQEQKQAKAFFQRMALRYANASAEYLGFGKQFYSVDHDAIQRILGNAWCNAKDFSARIWENRQRLAQTLQTDFVNAFIRGDSYQRISRMMRQKFQNVSKSNLERLVFTEDTYLAAESSVMPFSQYYDRYLYECADGNACATCRALQGESFPIRDRMPGLNFPPMHPWCRCTFTIDLDSRNKNPLPAARKAQSQAKSQALELLTSGADGGIIKEDNKSVRLWYHEHIHNIPNEIPDDLSMEERARKAFELRNYYRTEARNRMADEDARAELDAIRPNPSFDELIESKMRRKKMTREEAIQDIYETAVKSNPEYDKRAGL